MKSLASSDMASKASSSKSNSARVMLAKVSASLSPMKGESPDSLGEEMVLLLMGKETSQGG